MVCLERHPPERGDLFGCRGSCPGGRTSLSAATLDLAGVQLDAGRPLTLEVTADAPAELHLAGAFPAGSAVRSEGEVVREAVFSETGLRLPVGTGPRTYTISS